MIDIRIEEAFTARNQPIAPKVISIRKQLCDIESLEQLAENFFDDSLKLKLVDNSIKYENFYTLCDLHFKVANCVESDDVATTPIKNTQLWIDSVLWLAVHFKIIIHLAQNVDDKFMQFTNSKILWRLKWVLNDFVETSVSSQRLITLYNNLLDFYFDNFNLGKRSVYKTMVSQGVKMGKPDIVEPILKKWIEAEKNDFDDCWACQVDDIIRAYCFLGKYNEALDWAAGILDGSTCCGEVPHATNSLIAEAYFYTGDTQKALGVLQKGYPLIKQSSPFIRPIAQFMRLYHAMGMIETAVEIYEDNKELLKKCESQFQVMLFYIEAIKLPIKEKSRYLDVLLSLTTEFDIRNNNVFYSSQLPNSLSS